VQWGVGFDGGGVLRAAAGAVGPLLVTVMAVVALLVVVAQGGPLNPGRPSDPLAGAWDLLRALLAWLLQPGLGRAVVFVLPRRHPAGAMFERAR